MSLSKHESSLLVTLRCDMPVEVDPSEFTVALDLNDLGLLTFVHKGTDGRILALLTQKGQCYRLAQEEGRIR